MVLSLGISVISFAQDDADVQWFESLFVIPKNKSLDEERRLADIKRMGAVETEDKKAEAKALIEVEALVTPFGNSSNDRMKSLSACLFDNCLFELPSDTASAELCGNVERCLGRVRVGTTVRPFAQRRPSHNLAIR